MRTKKFKTLSGLYRALYNSEFTYSNFVDGRALFKDKEYGCKWCKFELDSKARREFAEGIAKVLWERPDEDKIRAVLRYYGRDYGIFGRLWYSIRYKPGEIRTLRKLIL